MSDQNKESLPSETIREAVKAHVDGKQRNISGDGEKKPDLFFETVAGLRVEFDPVNIDDLFEAEANIEAEFRERGEPLEPPKYAYTTAGGGTIEREHDQSTLEIPGDPEKTEANKAAWQAHIDARGQLLAEQSMVRTRMIIDAIKIDGVPDAWVERMERYHIKVPKDPYEREFKYKLRAILKNPDDLLTAMGKIMEASVAPMVPRELIDAQMQLFRGQVSEAARAAVAGRFGVLGEEPGGDTPGSGDDQGREGEGPLGAQREADRGGPGEELGDRAERPEENQQDGPGEDDGQG